MVFLLIFSTFLFDFLGYQTQNSKVITLFVKFYFKEKEPKKSTIVLLILIRKIEEISENESLGP